jgi:hypothetical protein
VTASAVIPSSPVINLAGGPQTLADLMTLARQESDTENDPNISDSELTNYINQSRFELYDMLITRFGDDYYTATATIATDGVNQLFPLPNGSLYNDAPAYYKGLLVEVLALGAAGSNPAQPSWVSLIPFQLREKNKFNLINYSLAVGYLFPRYRLQGSNLMFTPLPTGGLTIQLWYAPRLLPLVNDTDVAEDWSGWLEYVVVDAAIKCVRKQERDTTDLKQAKEALRQRIEYAAANRNIGDPAVVTELTSGSDGIFGWNGGAYGPWGW